MNVQEINQPPQFNPQTMGTLGWRSALIHRLIRIIFYLSLPAVLAASYYAIAEKTYGYLPVYAILIVFVGLLAFWNRLPDNLLISGLMSLIYMVALLDYLTEGRGSLAPLLLVMFAFTGALFFRKKGVVIAILAAILTMVVFAYAYTTELLPDYLVSSKILPGWVSNSMIILLIIAYVGFSLDFVIGEMTLLIQRGRELSHELEEESSGLEKTIAERTSAAEAARAEAEAARHEVEAQMWQAVGQAQLAERMRGEQAILLLANRIVSFLCQYLNAQAGLLYVVDGKKLNLSGGYAFTERPGFKETLEFGEGLIGQAASEGEMILIDEIPPDMLVIASGLGEARPNQILIMPLCTDTEVVGVVELATLTKFTPQQELFLSRAGGSIATSLLVAKARQQIADLLSDTQRQTSELRAREEELRAMNEELQAQAENLKTK